MWQIAFTLSDTLSRATRLLFRSNIDDSGEDVRPGVEKRTGGSMIYVILGLSLYRQ
jgi:hypothetical protein